METRKLQQVGGGTFTVSIPKDWATEHALEAGAEVHLYTHSDGSVVVRSAERDGGRLDAVTLDVDARLDSADADADADAVPAVTPAPVVRLLRAAGTVGFESVTLTSESGFTDEQWAAVKGEQPDVRHKPAVVYRVRPDGFAEGYTKGDVPLYLDSAMTLL